MRFDIDRASRRLSRLKPFTPAKTSHPTPAQPSTDKIQERSRPAVLSPRPPRAPRPGKPRRALSAKAARGSDCRPGDRPGDCADACLPTRPVSAALRPRRLDRLRAVAGYSNIVLATRQKCSTSVLSNSERSSGEQVERPRSIFELQKNEVKRLKSLSRAQNRRLARKLDRRAIRGRSSRASLPRARRLYSAEPLLTEPLG